MYITTTTTTTTTSTTTSSKGNFIIKHIPQFLILDMMGPINQNSLKLQTTYQ